MALRRSKTIQRSTKGVVTYSRGLAIAGIIVGTIGTMLLIYTVYILYLVSGLVDDILGQSGPNPAAADLKPLLQRLDALGAKQICYDSDDGQGLSSNVPLYYGYYKIADSPGLDNAVLNAAAQSGYQLHGSNKPNTDAFPDGKLVEGTVTDLTGQKNNESMDVSIYRDTQVRFDCTSDQSIGWDDYQSTNGSVIIAVSDRLQ